MVDEEKRTNLAAGVQLSQKGSTTDVEPVRIAGAELLVDSSLGNIRPFRHVNLAGLFEERGHTGHELVLVNVLYCERRHLRETRTQRNKEKSMRDC